MTADAAGLDARWAIYLRHATSGPPRQGLVLEPYAATGRKFNAADLARSLGVPVDEIRRLRRNFLVIVRHGYNKHRVYIFFGGQCCCDGCGATDIGVMTIDHVYGDGSQFRGRHGRSSHVNWRWIVKNNFPDGVDMKCFNCNCTKRDGKKCPRAGQPH